MEIREVVINNKAIEKISYYAYNKDDSQMLAIKNKINAVWNNHFIDRRGYKTYIEQCFLDSSDADIITIQTYYLEDDGTNLISILDDSQVPSDLKSGLSTARADREFHNDTQTIEVEYSSASLPFTMPGNCALRRQTHNLNPDYSDKGTYNVYVIGTVANVDALVKSENSSLSCTIPDGYTLAATDSFKLLYNSSDALQSCTLTQQDSFPYFDENLPDSVMHNLLLDKENIWHTFDITNSTRTFEIPYVIGGVYPVQPLGANLNLMYITETYDSSFNNTNVQNVYVQGRLNDVYTWAKSLKSDITLPIPDNINKPDEVMFEDDGAYVVQESEFVGNDDMDYLLFEDAVEGLDNNRCIILEQEILEDEDYFKFTFDSSDNLTSVKLIGHLQNQMTRSRKVRRRTQIEHNFKYQDAITNLGTLATLVPDSAITLSVPKYDMNGFRYADD